MSAAVDRSDAWEQRAFDALTRAQAMSEAIRAIAHIVSNEESQQNVFSLMQAIDACTGSIDLLVDPIVNEGRPQ